VPGKQGRRERRNVLGERCWRGCCMEEISICNQAIDYECDWIRKRDEKGKELSSNDLLHTL
jgi:hypothetical protein